MCRQVHVIFTIARRFYDVYLTAHLLAAPHKPSIIRRKSQLLLRRIGLIHLLILGYLKSDAYSIISPGINLYCYQLPLEALSLETNYI